MSGNESRISKSRLDGVISFKWTIPDFQMTEYKRTYLQYFFTNGGDYEWKLQLYCTYESNVNYMGLSVCLKNNLSHFNEIKTRTEFAIVNSEHQMLYGQSMQRKFTKGQEHYLSLINSETRITEDLLDNKNFVLEFRLDVVGSKSSRDLTHQILMSRDIEKHLWTDLLTGKDGIFNDVVLRVNESSVYAHSAILAARSKVFRQRLLVEKAKKKEKTEKDEHSKLLVLYINDLTHEILLAILEYVYRGKIASINQLAAELLRDSLKYGMKSLHNLCQDVLIANMTVDNAVDMLMLADRYGPCAEHGSCRLKYKALEFIREHSSNVTNSESFEKLLLDSPDLVTMIVDYV